MTFFDRFDEHLVARGAEFSSKHPSLVDLWRLLGRHPYIVLALFGLIPGIALGLNRSLGGDLTAFRESGLNILSGKWSKAYDDAFVQVGPLYLILVACVTELARLVRIEMPFAMSLLIWVVSPVATVFALRRLFQSRKLSLSTSLLLYIGVVVILGGVKLTQTWLFLDEVLTGILWLLAGADAKESRGWRAGLLLGISAGIKSWGIIGAPILLMSSRRRGSLEGWVVQGSLFVAMYVPFILLGAETMKQTWPIASYAPIHRLLGLEGNFTWEMRFAQAAAAGLAGAVFTFFFRRTAAVVWAAPAVIIAVKVVLDPSVAGHYWQPVAITLLIGSATLVARAPTWAVIPLVISVYFLSFPFLIITDDLLLGIWAALFSTAVCIRELKRLLRAGARTQFS